MLTNSDVVNSSTPFKQYYVVTINEPLMRIAVTFTLVAPSTEEIRNCFRSQWLTAMRYNKDSFQVCGKTFAEPKLFARKVPLQFQHASDGMKRIPVKDMLYGGAFIYESPQGLLVFNDSMIQVVPLWTWVQENRMDLQAVLTIEDIPEGGAFPERMVSVTETPLSMYDHITRGIV